jgi:hypothetical protein
MSKTYLKGKRRTVKPSGIFKEGFLPPADAMPAERTHERARLLYNVLLAILVYYPKRKDAALKEIQDINRILHDRILFYMSKITPEDIEFVKKLVTGTYDHYDEDDKLVIIDPVKDHPILMCVYEHEQPESDNFLIVPGDRSFHLPDQPQFDGGFLNG